MRIPANPLVSPAIVQHAKHLFLKTRTTLTDQFGLVDQVTPPPNELPEFLFLGSTNVGKSSLLTELLNPVSRSPPKKGTQPSKDLPRTSKYAGFTSTISIYTVGKLIRLVDSPGYGFKSKVNQGEVVTKYLETRGHLLRQAYVLIHAKRGVGIQDREASALLAQLGVPFTFVVTKHDLLKPAEKNEIYETYLDVCKELQVPPNDRLLLTSTQRKYGVDELRGEMLQTSGLLEFKNEK